MFPAITKQSHTSKTEQSHCRRLGNASGLDRQIIDNDAIIKLYQFLPAYNLGNVTSWVNTGDGMVVMGGLGGGLGTPFSLETSVLLLVLWVIGLVGTTALIFQRRDLTN